MGDDGIGLIGWLAAAVFLALASWMGRLAFLARAEGIRSMAEVQRLTEVLDTSPDGLFTWDLKTGREYCSRRLAVLLSLADGTDSNYYDLRNSFEGEASAAFDRAVGSLRRDGSSFDLLLPVQGRLLHVVGARAGTRGGDALADVLWMRDVDGIPGAMAQPVGADTALGAAYDSFQYLLDSLPVPIWLRDADLNVAFTNRACDGPELAIAARDLAEKARQEGKAATAIRSEGDQAQKITETPVRGWVGTAGFAEKVCSAPDVATGPDDLGARERALESLDIAVAIYGPELRLEFANPAYAALWRLDADWLAGHPSYVQVLDRRREARRLPEVADFRAFRESEVARLKSLKARGVDSMHLPDGSSVQSVATPRPGGGVVFVETDVTDRLSLERDVRRLEAVRRETLDNLQEGVAVFGADGRLRLCNPSFRALWKLEPEQLPEGAHLSTFVDLARPLLPATDDDWEARCKRLVAGLMSRDAVQSRVVRVDGSIIDHTKVPLPDGAVLLSYLDVSDSARVEMALRERAQALDEANRLKSSFIANVSHEIRTPMTTIMGFAETLTQEYFGKLNPRQMEYGEGILESSRTLMRVVEDILDLASIEAGTMALELDSIEVNSMLVEVLGLLRERAKRRAIGLEFDCPADIGWLVADRRRIKQVAFNLLSNAIRFTPGQGKVKLKARREQEELVLEIADNGVGIPQADQERMFGSFEIGPPPAQGPAGPGLGLTIVRQFVELHGGRVSMRSNPGKGTTITCRLPTAGPIGDQKAFPTAGL